MRKEYFLQLGGFDPGMKVWGTEQIELSVKVWLCGGRVEMIPCSRVVHMFRYAKKLFEAHIICLKLHTNDHQHVTVYVNWSLSVHSVEIKVFW